MGIVHLTNSHHELYIHNKEPNLGQRVVMDAELLARPILSSVIGNPPLGDYGQKMVRNALRGLLEMRGFNAAVSYQVVEKEGVPYIALPKRVWGEITLGSPCNIVVGFSHDKRYDNRPFFTLVQWLEEEGPGGELSEEEFFQFVNEWHSSRWREFFESRVRRAHDALIPKIFELRREADELVAKIATIKAALNQF